MRKFLRESKLNSILISFTTVCLPIIIVIKSNNTYYFDFLEIVKSFFVISVLFFLVLILVLCFIKDKKKLVPASLTLFYFFFFYGFIEKLIFSLFNLTNFIVQVFSILIWIFLFCFVLNFFLKTKKNDFKIIYFFFYFLFIFNIFDVTKDYLKDKKRFEKNVVTQDVFQGDTYKDLKINEKKNVYILLPDMHASKKYITKLYPDFDESLTKILLKYKFKINNQSLSNYSHSSVSIPSILNAKYFNDAQFKKKKLISKFYKESIRDKNLIEEVFKKQNYNTIYLRCEGDYITKQKKCFLHKNLDFLSFIDINLFEAVIASTPLNFNFITKFLKRNIGKKQFIGKFSESISKSFKGKKDPFILFAHIGIPHPPYMFDKNCDFKIIPKNENTINNSLITDKKSRYQGYKDNLSCSTKIIEETIEIIINYDDDPLIFVFSDHGPHLNHSKNANELDLVEDTHSSLLAVKPNKYCSSNNFENFFHVNIFRYILKCLGNEKIKIIENNFIYYTNPRNDNDSHIKFTSNNSLKKMNNNGSNR